MAELQVGHGAPREHERANRPVALDEGLRLAVLDVRGGRDPLLVRDPDLAVGAVVDEDLVVARVVDHADGDLRQAERLEPADDRAPVGVLRFRVAHELAVRVRGGGHVPVAQRARDRPGAGQRVAGLEVCVRDRVDPLEVAPRRAGVVGGDRPARRVAEAEVAHVDGALVGHLRVQPELAPQVADEVRVVEERFLYELHPLGAVLDARRDDEIHVPRVRADAVREVRERPDRAELEADVAVAAEERQPRRLVAVRGVVGVSVGVLRRRGRAGRFGGEQLDPERLEGRPVVQRDVHHERAGGRRWYRRGHGGGRRRRGRRRIVRAGDAGARQICVHERERPRARDPNPASMGRAHLDLWLPPQHSLVPDHRGELTFIPVRGSAGNASGRRARSEIPPSRASRGTLGPT